MNRRLECLLLFGVPPLIVYFASMRAVMIGLLWSSALLVWFFLKRYDDFSMRAEWNRAAVMPGLKEVLPRFVVAALAMLLFTQWIAPDRLFSFPRERPMFWAIVMLLYPPLSAVPQELIFRSFFFRRYGTVMGKGIMPLLWSGMTFGYAHFFLSNWVAVPMCAAGGCLFAYTYTRHRSLALVSLEHALYGCWVFTLGLGMYFYSGAHLHG